MTKERLSEIIKKVMDENLTESSEGWYCIFDSETQNVARKITEKLIEHGLDVY